MKNLVSITNDLQKKVLVSTIQKLKDTIIEENKKINLCIHSLETFHGQYCKYLNELEIEIKILRNNLNLNKSEKEKIEVDVDLNMREELKLLFRKISSKCHPDKTDNELLHELFKKAKLAYSILDYSELKNIYNNIYEENYVISDESEIDILKKQLKKIEQDYMFLISKNTYILTKLYNSDKTIDKLKSKKMFLDLLFSKIFELEELKSNLTGV